MTVARGYEVAELKRRLDDQERIHKAFVAEVRNEIVTRLARQDARLENLADARTEAVRLVAQFVRESHRPSLSDSIAAKRDRAEP